MPGRPFCPTPEEDETRAGSRDGASGEDDRRSSADRRSGIERRGAGLSLPLSPEPRPYGFREFGDRRSHQDRRLYGTADGRFREGTSRYAETSITLTREEILALLSTLDIDS